uniref:Glycosyl transferase CAP10 domain-containing protein n=1 Tax=Strigamia maritima TaxID=126957 RepID=T1ILJ2_STRMM
MNFFIYFYINFLLIYKVDLSHIKIDPHQTIVFGPGLTPNSVYPVQYFFIQAVDKNGMNITSKLDNNIFIVHIDGSGTENRCRIWTQTLNRHDGSFIVRYKLYEPCSNLKIQISYNNKPVANSPYISENKQIYQEECFCPKNNIKEWLKDMDCPSTYKQIDLDLAIFKQINMSNILDEVKVRFNHPKSESVCHYAIFENNVYRECFGEYVGFKMFIDAILLSILRKTKMPNVEFFVNLGDWPLEKRAISDNPLPIFSWCKSDNVRDIVMPTYDITESTLESMGRVTLDMLSVQQNSGVPWKNKTEKAIWRGRDSRLERLQLITLSRQNSHLLDAAITDFFFFRDKISEYGPRVNHMSFFDFFKYKYQVNVDGTVAAYRFPYLLGGGSAVFKQDSQYYEHFYNDLQPMVHYIPFKRDLNDLIKTLQWALENDDEVRKIAENGKKFVQENLMPKDIYCYYAILLKKFSSLLQESPVINEKMELVSQPESSKSACDCPKIKKTEKDEL